MSATCSELLRSKMVLLTLGNDNSISKLHPKKYQTDDQTSRRSLCSYMHMESTGLFISEAAIQKKNK